MDERDKNKITKAGFATPRGGAKGAYQNHVDRSNKVILPFEFLPNVDTEKYQDGWVVRLFPHQAFAAPGQMHPGLAERGIVVGDNAFVLYRTHESFEELPPLPGWEVRYLTKDGNRVGKRKAGARDHGHYVLRLPTLGARAERSEGPPQGLFATEYADRETNFLCKCVLAWMITRATGAAFSAEELEHLFAILDDAGLRDEEHWTTAGVLKDGEAHCPLCALPLGIEEFHETLALDAEAGLENAGHQVEGATRSTKVNLFHLRPLVYRDLVHTPRNIAWGHATCNTRLGQRPSYSLVELAATGTPVTLGDVGGRPRSGWLSQDDTMIRSEDGAVWIQIVRSHPTQGSIGSEAVVDAGELPAGEAGTDTAEPMPE